MNKPGGKFRTYVPTALRAEVVQWYHLQILYPGTIQMIKSITQYFAWPKMHATIRLEVINCPDFQHYKITAGHRYVHLKRNNYNIKIPWIDVHVDLICSWLVDVKYSNGTTCPNESQRSSSLTVPPNSLKSYPHVTAQTSTSRNYLTKIDSVPTCSPRELYLTLEESSRNLNFKKPSALMV